MNDIHKFWDANLKKNVVRVLPGDFYVTSNSDEVIVTTLGSCISVCIRDIVLQIGGLNHFMLPASETDEKDQVDGANRYGDWAMESLINAILRQGGKKENLEIKIFGGSNMLSTNSSIGKRNIEFIEKFIKTESLKITSQDTGGNLPRKIIYSPLDGEAKVGKIKRTISVQEAEEKYNESIIEKPIGGDAELF